MSVRHFQIPVFFGGSPLGTQQVLWLEMAVVVLNSSTKSTVTYLRRRGLIKELDHSEPAAVCEWRLIRGLDLLVTACS
jgi:hypothetical protein